MNPADLSRAREAVSTIKSTSKMFPSAVAWAKGALPFLWRFGVNRSKTKIAVLADDQSAYDSIRTTFMHFNLIPEKNLVFIRPSDHKFVDGYRIVIIHESALDVIFNVLSRLNSKTGLIVYAPTRRLDAKQSSAINEHPVSTLVNFKGRLMNDVISTLASIKYVKE